jgi:hypothetical protein
MLVSVDDARLFSVAPERSLEQRRLALLRANVIRSARAEWKRQAHRGEVSVRDMLLEPGELFESMKIIDLLLARPKVGRVKATTMLRIAATSPTKTLGGLTVRQRGELARLLP